MQMKKCRSSASAERRPRPRSSWMSLILMSGFLLSAAIWLGGRPALRWWRSRQAGEFLAAARSQMEREEWGEAARWMREAFERAPDDPEVVRAIADFQIRTHAHPSDVIQTLQRLSSTRDAAHEDSIKLMRAQVDLGSYEAAHKTLAQLPETVRSSSAEAAEAEAYLLKMERRDSEADARLRVALNAGSDDVETSLKLAILDLKQPHPEIRERGRKRLWRMAREGGAYAVEAIGILSADPLLSAGEGERLLEIVEGVKHADKQALRYAVLAALVRLRPEERDAILNRETATVADKEESQRLAFACWLSSLNEHKRLLAFLPAKLKWKEMSADMARLKLEALAQAGRWDELHAALDHDLEKILGAVSFNLWLARSLAAQGGDVSRVQQHLNLAFSATDRGQDSQAAVQVAEAAEKLGAQDLAAAFYRAMAALASSPQFRIALLEKAYALHLDAHDTHGMLLMATEVAGLTPGNQANAFRADYLALLAGESMELVASRIAAMQTSADAAFCSRLLLLKSMVAFRLHNRVQDLEALKKLRDQPLEPGPRAVLAAMLATRGDTAAGFQIAEKISTALLLPEEKKFLALAR